MKKIEKEIFITFDWTEFESEAECKIYELQHRDPIIETEVYLYSPEWNIYKQLVDDWFVFDQQVMWKLKYILSETKVKIRLDTTTWVYKVLEFNWRKIKNK